MLSCMYKINLTDRERFLAFFRTVTDPNPTNKARVELEEELLRGGRATAADLRGLMEVFREAHKTGWLRDHQFKTLAAWLVNLVNSRAIPKRQASWTMGPRPGSMVRG